MTNDLSRVRLLLVIALNALVHRRREIQVLVDVARIRIVARADRKILLLLELHDLLTARRAVAMLLHLHHQRAGLLFVEAFALAKLLHQLLIVEEMARDYREDQPAEVAD